MYGFYRGHERQAVQRLARQHGGVDAGCRCRPIGAGVLDRVTPLVILLIALFVALASAGWRLGLFILDLIERQRP